MNEDVNISPTSKKMGDIFPASHVRLFMGGILLSLFAYIYTIRVHHRGRSIYQCQADLSKLTASAGELRRSRGGSRNARAVGKK